MAGPNRHTGSGGATLRHGQVGEEVGEGQHRKWGVWRVNQESHAVARLSRLPAYTGPCAWGRATRATFWRMPPKGMLGWLAELVAQINADHDLIGPGRYVSYNFLIGLILIGVAAIILVEPGHGSASAGATLGVIGLLLCAGVPVARFRPGALDGVLLAQGTALVVLSLSLGAGAVLWALRAPPHAPFRYMPGVTLVLLVYGALQIASYRGGRAGFDRRLRRTALFVGAACELVVAASLIIRLYRS